MVDLLLVVEAFLDGENIVHRRDQENAVCFDLPFGRTSYDCRVVAEDRKLIVGALWRGRVDTDDAERAQRLLTRLWNTGDSGGNTHFNPARGKLMFASSVDVSCADVTVDTMASILETLLDPFNVRILAMQMVLSGQMPETAAVDCYAEWNRNRIAALMRPLGEGGGADPSLN
ncbi:MAG TPA: hypothetical protein VF669_21535 [Tepidisphaeraceae bacterium]|jgi:hypothetical protein